MQNIQCLSKQEQLEKALGERRYLRQGKAIRQLASPSLLCQQFPYAPFNATVTKISKWFRIQDSCRITPKIESLVVYAMPDIPSKFQKDPSITFWVILLTHRQRDKQTNKVRQKHYLLGKGNYSHRISSTWIISKQQPNRLIRVHSNEITVKWMKSYPDAGFKIFHICTLRLQQLSHYESDYHTNNAYNISSK